jgi:GT2 family glycosyltransferase
VLDQRYPALEYVVQDGGSTDRTQEILRLYEDRLTSWESAPDSGQADAINRGFARTSGEIMAYLNADDLLLPGALAYVGRYFASHPEVDVVYGHRVIVDVHDLQIGAWVLPAHDDDVLAIDDFVPQETLFWRRRAWEAAGGAMDTSFRFALDWDLLLRFRATGAKMVRVPRFLGAFRVHGGQKTLMDQEGCLIESDRLRQRLHGRTMSHEEVQARVAPYLRRHIVHHTAHRLAARAPFPRQAVRTLPGEP